MKGVTDLFVVWNAALTESLNDAVEMDLVIDTKPMIELAFWRNLQITDIIECTRKRHGSKLIER
jgi:hypothetical protein